MPTAIAIGIHFILQSHLDRTALGGNDIDLSRRQSNLLDIGLRLHLSDEGAVGAMHGNGAAPRQA